jgi:hypothetical protein
VIAILFTRQVISVDSSGIRIEKVETVTTFPDFIPMSQERYATLEVSDQITRIRSELASVRGDDGVHNATNPITKPVPTMNNGTAPGLPSGLRARV